MPRLLPTFALLASAASAHTVTFNEHIAPIIYAHCGQCHRPGQIGPFSLLSYDDVRRHASTIAAVTQSRFMPPWKPQPGWVVYRDERRLTPAQIALIQQWVADDAPEGDSGKAVRPPVYSDGWQLGTPDLILEMPASFSVPAESNDIYRNFVLPAN